MSYPLLGTPFQNSAEYISVDVSQTAHGFKQFDAIYLNDGAWARAYIDSSASIGAAITTTTIATHLVYQVTTNTFVAVSAGRVHVYQHGLGKPGQTLYLSTVPGAISTARPFASHVQQIATVISANEILVQLRIYGANIAPEYPSIMVSDGTSMQALSAPEPGQLLIADSAQPLGVRWTRYETGVAPDRTLASKYLDINAGESRHVTLDAPMSAVASAHVDVFEERAGATATRSAPWDLNTASTEVTSADMRASLGETITKYGNTSECLIVSDGFTDDFIGREMREYGGTGQLTIMSVLDGNTARGLITVPFSSDDLSSVEVMSINTDSLHRISLSGFNGVATEWEAFKFHTATSSPHVHVSKALTVYVCVERGRLLLRYSYNYGGSYTDVDVSAALSALSSPIYDLSNPRVFIDGSEYVHVVVRGALSLGGTQLLLHVRSTNLNAGTWELFPTYPTNTIIITTLGTHELIVDDHGVPHVFFVATVGGNRDLYVSRADMSAYIWGAPVLITRTISTLSATITDVLDARISVVSGSNKIRVVFTARNSAVDAGAVDRIFAAYSNDYGESYADIIRVDTGADAAINSSQPRAVFDGVFRVIYHGRSGDVRNEVYYVYGTLMNALNAPVKVTTSTVDVTQSVLVAHQNNLTVIFINNALRYARLEGTWNTYEFGAYLPISTYHSLHAYPVSNSAICFIHTGTHLARSLLAQSPQFRAINSDLLIDDINDTALTYVLGSLSVRDFEAVQYTAYTKIDTVTTIGVRADDGSVSALTLAAGFNGFDQQFPLIAVTAGRKIHIVWTGIHSDESPLSHIYYTYWNGTAWDGLKTGITTVIPTQVAFSSQSTMHADFIAHADRLLIVGPAPDSGYATTQIFFNYGTITGIPGFLTAPIRVSNLTYFDTRTCSYSRIVAQGNKYWVLFYCTDDTQYYISTSTDYGATWNVSNTAGTPIPVFDANVCRESRASIVYVDSTKRIHAVCAGAEEMFGANSANHIHSAFSTDSVTWTRTRITPPKHNNDVSDESCENVTISRDANNLYIAYTMDVNLFMAVSTNYGSTWTVPRWPVFTASSFPNTNVLQFTASPHLRLYFVARPTYGENNNLFRADIRQYLDMYQPTSPSLYAALSTVHQIVSAPNTDRYHIVYSTSTELRIWSNDSADVLIVARPASVLYADIKLINAQITLAITAAHNDGVNFELRHYVYDTRKLSLLHSATIYSCNYSEILQCNRIRHIRSTVALSTYTRVFMEYIKDTSPIIAHFNLDASLSTQPLRVLRVGYTLDDAVERATNAYVMMHSADTAIVMESTDGLTWSDDCPGSFIQFEEDPGYSFSTVATSTQVWSIFANEHYVYARNAATTSAYIFDHSMHLMTTIEMATASADTVYNAISANSTGRVVAVGYANANGTRGFIKVYLSNTSTTGTSLGYFPATITSADATLAANNTPGEPEGRAIAVNSDGTVIASGIPLYSAGNGWIMVYTVTNPNNWTGTITAPTSMVGISMLTANFGTVFANAYIGTNVAIGGSGSTEHIVTSVYLGTRGGAAYTGAVLVYVRGASWTSRSSPTYIMDVSATPAKSIRANYGSISTNGNTVVVNGNTGIQVFTSLSTRTSADATLTSGVLFTNVSISPNGQRVYAIGGSSIHVYFNPGSWTGDIAATQTIFTGTGSIFGTTLNIFHVNQPINFAYPRIKRFIFAQIAGEIIRGAMVSDSTTIYAMIAANSGDDAYVLSAYSNAGSWSSIKRASRSGINYGSIEHLSLMYDDINNNGDLYANVNGTVLRADKSNLNNWQITHEPMSRYNRYMSTIGPVDSFSKYQSIHTLPASTLYDVTMVAAALYTLIATSDNTITTVYQVYVNTGYTNQWKRVRVIDASNRALALCSDKLVMVNTSGLHVLETSGDWGTGAAGALPGIFFNPGGMYGTTRSLAISSDGNTIVVGHSATTNGGFYVYQAINGSFGSVVTYTYNSAGISPGDFEGQCVAISSDGSTIVSGSSTMNGVNVYIRTTSSLTRVATLSVGGGISEGIRCAITADASRIVVSDSGLNGGIAHVYDRPNALWDSTATLRESVSNASDENDFSDLALNGDIIFSVGISNATKITAHSVELNASYEFPRTASNFVPMFIASAGPYVAVGSATSIHIYRSTFGISSALFNTSPIITSSLPYAPTAQSMLIERVKYDTVHPSDRIAAITRTINVTNWSSIDDVTVSVTVPTVWFAVGLNKLDSETTYYVVNGTFVREIARVTEVPDGYIYMYNSSTVFSETIWTDLTVSSVHVLLERAMDISTNRMDSTQFNAATVFPSLSDIDDMRISVILTSNNGISPIINSIQLTYTSGATFVQSNQYTVDLSGLNSVIITAPSTLSGRKNIHVHVT